MDNQLSVEPGLQPTTVATLFPGDRKAPTIEFSVSTFRWMPGRSSIRKMGARCFPDLSTTEFCALPAVLC
jgi:hypothetical protein